MSSMLVEGLLKTIATFHPEYSSMINFVLAHEDQFEKLAPIADAAVKEGPGAFAAAKEHAPELAKAIEDFVDSIPGTAATPAEAQTKIDNHREVMTRHLAGVAKAETTETSSWLDRPVSTGA
jgi:hypothetical protein